MSSAKTKPFILTAVFIYVGVLIAAPLAAILGSVFLEGVGKVFRFVLEPEVLAALRLTLLLALGAVVLNAFFGSIVAWVLVRYHFFGRRFLNAIVDLPFAVSPVVAGYLLILLFGRTGWFAGFESWSGFQVLFSWPGMLWATTFVSLPFVVREVMPILKESGVDQEQAAFTLGAGSWTTFWKVTLPAIRWGLIYGMTLTFARALGEFGAVFVISGAVSGKTETATLFIYRALEERQDGAAYGVALILAAVSFLVLFALEYIKKKEKR